MKNILIIEDSDNLREAVKNYLILSDFQAYDFSNIEEARSFTENSDPDLAILDINLPDGNGFFFAKEELVPKNIPFIFLSSRFEESDKVLGFEIGADDYITKPFSLKELTLRTMKILDRKSRKTEAEEIEFQYLLDDCRLYLNENTHCVTLDDKSLILTPTEWAILTCFIHHCGAILSRDQIKKSIWNISDKMTDKTLDSHIKNIRNKLNNYRWIETVRSFGFRFNGHPMSL